MRALHFLFKPRETGQAMIFVAVLAAVIMGVAGLAVEGSRLLVEHRQIQNTADLAALVGAQSAGCPSTTTSCINDAITDACLAAQKNGYGGGVDTSKTPYDCLSTSDTTVHAYMPPQTCSPYNVDYGNGKKASNNCVSSGAGSFYNYIEVTISRNIGVLPIFRVGVTPTAHAVAMRGSQSPRDFALVVLDNSISKELNFGGSAGSKAAGTCGICIIGSVMSNATNVNSIYAGGNGTEYTCGGQWYTASSSETSVSGNTSNVGSYTVGSAFFSPPGCTGTADSPTAWNYAQNPIADPYDGVGIPGAGGYQNCTPCGALGHYYHWTKSTGRSGGTWDDGTQGAGYPKSNSGTDSYEYFPGYYPNGITINGGYNYFNPGYYNIGTGGIKDNGGTACVFGAPICEAFPTVGTYTNQLIPGQSQTCFSASMQTGVSNSVDPRTWYYYCSSWGTWDTSPPNGTNGLSSGIPAALKTAVPHFTIGTSPTTTPLNGVSFYSTSGIGSSTVQTGGKVDIEGSAVMSLAFPNPCPGTTSAVVSNSVPFQTTMGSGDSGSTGESYSYSASSIAGALSSSPAGNLYPSADLTVSGENTCRSLLNSGNSQGRIPDVWPGESPGNGQLIQFLFFLRDKTASITLAGGGTQIWWGIIYNPGDWKTNGGCGALQSGCQISMSGSAGTGGSTDIPMVVGQVIGDGINFTGSSTIEIFYRPCDPRTSSCQQGPGSSLVQ